MIAGFESIQGLSRLFGIVVLVAAGACATELHVADHPQSSIPAETVTPDNDQKVGTVRANTHDQVLRTCTTFRYYTINDADLPKFPAEVRQRLASFSGSNATRTDEFLSASELQQFMKPFESPVRINSLSAPRVTLFDGQSTQMVVQTQQAYIDSLSARSKTEDGKPVSYYEPHIATVMATGIVTSFTATVSTDRRGVNIDLNCKLHKLLGLVSEHWPDAPANVEAKVQRPITVTYERKLRCTIPDGMTLMVSGWTRTIVDKRNSTAVVSAGPRRDEAKAADAAIEEERRTQIYLLVTPTIRTEQDDAPAHRTARFSG